MPIDRLISDLILEETVSNNPVFNKSGRDKPELLLGHVFTTLVHFLGSLECMSLLS